MAASSLPPPRALPVLIWALVLSVATGLAWSVMAARLGPTLGSTGAFTPAAQGSEYLRDLQPRYLWSQAVEGTATLIPFEAMLWGDPTGTKCRLTRMQAEVLVAGLTHVDFVVDQRGEDRLLFRLSRHPGVPSGFIRQESGLGHQWPCERDWSVPEATLPPARRAELMQVNYEWPHRTRDLIAREFRGRRLRVEIERRGDLVCARVDGEPAGEVHIAGLGHGAWGIEGGDLPFAHLGRIGFQGRQMAGGDWRGFDVDIDLTSPEAAVPRVAANAVRPALWALGSLVLFAAAGWLIAPGAGALRWLQRSLVAGALVAWLPGRAVLFHDVAAAPSLAHVWTLSVWAWSLVLGLSLAGAGAHWRWRAGALSAGSVLRRLRANLRGLGWLGRVAWMGSLLAVLAAAWSVQAGLLIPPTPRKQPVEVEFIRDGTLRRGDFPYSRPKGFPDRDFVNGGMRLTLEATEEPTEVELLTRLHDKSLPSYPEWVALRLSTEHGESGFLESWDEGVVQPVALELASGETLDIALWCEGNDLIAAVASEEFGRFRTSIEPFGQCAVVIRRGGVRVGVARAWGEVDDYERPGSSLLHVLPTAGWITGLFVLGVVGAIALAWPLGSWLGLRAGGTALVLLPFGLAAAGAATWQGLWWLSRPLQEYWSSPRFALWAGLLVALGGLQMLLASHWPRLRQRILPSLAVLLGLAVCTEGAIRCTEMRWTFDARTPRGYVHRGLLLRWLQEPMVLMSLTGQLHARGEDPRVRDPGDRRQRIICLGGSSTYGSGVASDAETWPALLETHFGQTEVYNFGRPSLTAFDNFLFLRRDLLALDPDWVILSCGGNDAVRPVGNPPPQRERWDMLRGESRWETAFREAITASRLLVFANRWMSRALTPVDRQRRVPQHPPGELRETLRQLCGLGRREGFRVALVAEPTWDATVSDQPDLASWHRVIAEVASEEGAVFINPAPRLRDAMADHVWATWIHLNERGNRMMADEIAAALAREVSPEFALQP